MTKSVKDLRKYKKKIAPINARVLSIISIKEIKKPFSLTIKIDKGESRNIPKLLIKPTKIKANFNSGLFIKSRDIKYIEKEIKDKTKLTNKPFETFKERFFLVLAKSLTSNVEIPRSDNKKNKPPNEKIKEYWPKPSAPKYLDIIIIIT